MTATPYATLAELRARVLESPVAFDQVVPELLPTLAATILKISTVQPRYASKNIGGWKSNEEIFTESPALKTLSTALRRHFLNGWQPAGWAMVNRKGSEHPRHQHRRAMVCGVYYVTAGDPVTPTIFETETGEVAYTPAPGRLVLFAGETWHRVPKYLGEAPRITIAFDVRR